MRHAFLASAILLSACTDSNVANQADAPQEVQHNRAAAPLDAPAGGNGFSIEEQQDGLDFAYSWPAQADSIADLRARLHAEMEQQKAEAIGYVRDDRAQAAQDGREAHGHYYSRVWSVSGASARLLSLSASEETFTGGAHGNQRFHALLWDRQAGEVIQPTELLGPALAGLAPRFCAALNRERAERRGEPVIPSEDPDDDFNACPALAELVLAPTDEDGNGRFERLAVLIPPYVAGPYAEGGYVIDLPLETGDIERAPAGWRGQLEPGRPLPRDSE